ncbi:hypothetical protein [Amycolatopsis eburnea]|uniref:Uncharacterized protein n=1 Tax=Amycolatopsis eburnea TaxID=2267691 RepID=A0A3R9FER6_9PSEU|nr:hypothetical protein [Amycolatopsis eburnea]RSD26354.1 hypothetical protein EIY87_00385 [Amycolatopsis eburnea]
MTWSLDQAARVMGMPVHEVLAVAEVGNAHVVTTHDGQHTVITSDGIAHAIKRGASRDDLLALGFDEDEVAELDAARESADPATADPATGGQQGLDPNAAAVAERARLALEHPDGQVPPPPVPVPHPEAAADDLTPRGEALEQTTGGKSEEQQQAEAKAKGDGGQGNGGTTPPAGDEVPDGNAQSVLDWVGDDEDRARRALEVEQGREKPRTGLVAELAKKVEQA